MNIYEMLALITIRFALKRIVKSDKPFIYFNKIAVEALLTFYLKSALE